MRTGLVSAALLLAACGASQPAAECQPAPDTQTTMRDHFAYTRATLPLIINGKLAAARAKAASIAMVLLPDKLTHWGPFVERMRAAAETLADTHSLSIAARALADVAVECGQCHKSLDVDVRFEPVAEPTDGSQMRHHAWAASRMWEGLVGPSDKLWAAGAAGLQWTALHEPELAPNVESLIKSLAGRVRTLGARAATADNPISRARVYGQLLGTCAVCHQLARPR